MTPTSGGPQTATLSGPESGTEGISSANFTITLDQSAQAGGVSCTITDSESGDTITGTPIVIAEGKTTGTFRITAESTGNRTITLYSTRPSLIISGSPINYNAVEAGEAIGYTVTGPATAPIGATSRVFTVTPVGSPVRDATTHIYSNPGTYTGDITITLSDGMTGTIVKTFVDESTPKTFTITAPTGSDETPIRMTMSSDPQLGVDPDPITVTKQTLYDLDDSITMPCTLGSADTYYRLTDDITTTGPGFAITANNITFDLNGHTILYDTGPTLSVPNNGFETGTLANWDVSNAPAATIASARLGMWGNYMLSLPNIATTQVIKSSAITLYDTGELHIASIFPKTDGEAIVTLEVLDENDNVLGSGNSPDVGRGFAAKVEFTPSPSVTTVYLKITVIPSGTTTVDLDYASVHRDGVYGIWAGASRSGVIICNGTITQGAANSAYASPILCSANGYTIDGITASATGLDTRVISGHEGGNSTITNCNVTSNLDRIMKRMDIFAGISCSKQYGDVRIEHNTITGTGQQGIYLENGSTGVTSAIVRYNVMTQTSIVTEGYGIEFLQSLNNAECAYNTCLPTNGRGILVDGRANTGIIHDNYVVAIETPNLEYGPKTLEATGLRMRAYPNEAQTNVHVYDNVFRARRVSGGCWQALGMRLYLDNSEGNNTNAGHIYENNVLVGIVEEAQNFGGGYNATGVALAISGYLAEGTGTIIRNNILESNNISLNIGDNDSFTCPELDLEFISNTHAKSSEYSSVATYIPIQAGTFSNTVTDTKVIDPKYSGGAVLEAPVIPYAGNGSYNIDFGWLLDVKVTSGGTAVPNAPVTITDNRPLQQYSLTTDDNGWCLGIHVVTDNYAATPGVTPTYTSYNQITVAASYLGQSGSQTLTIDHSQSLEIAIL